MERRRNDLQQDSYTKIIVFFPHMPVIQESKIR